MRSFSSILVLALTLVVTLAFSVSAFAKKIPIDTKPTRQTPVSEMTCAQAKAFSLKHGYYWKVASGNDLVPMYPIETDYRELTCSSKNFPMPQFEQTMDETDCVLSWYCHSN